MVFFCTKCATCAMMQFSLRNLSLRAIIPFSFHVAMIALIYVFYLDIFIEKKQHYMQ